MATFEPSIYQQAVFKWGREHRVSAGALIVEAVAGSGKTTTIVQMAQVIPEKDKATFLAFNKKIADELATKLPKHIEAKTLNALGWSVCRYRIGKDIQVERNKTRNIIRNVLPEEAEAVMAELLNIVAKAKSHGLIPRGYPVPNGTYECSHNRWEELAFRYDVDVDPSVMSMDQFYNWAEKVLAAGLEDKRRFDFDDQLYMPVALDLPCWGYDWVIIDEAQDVSHVQRTLLRKFLKRSGRLIAVGDTHQAIYGFRGADSQSMANIRRVFNCDSLPLSICYRCPKSVVREAQQYVPHIEASETAEEGEVLRPTTWSLGSFSDTDMVVCRNTAPLIEFAYKCIADGKKVTVLGREIGQGLVNVLRKAGGKYADELTMEELGARLEKWRDHQVAKARDDETKLASIDDRLQCIRVMILSAEAEHGAETRGAHVIAAVNALFDDQVKGLTLCTIHKAKGLEAPRVFILEPDLVPSPWARKDWQVEQERNLAYVAITRALETLVYLPLSVVG